MKLYGMCSKNKGRRAKRKLKRPFKAALTLQKCTCISPTQQDQREAQFPAQALAQVVVGPLEPCQQPRALPRASQVQPILENYTTTETDAVSSVLIMLIKGVNRLLADVQTRSGEHEAIRT